MNNLLRELIAVLRGAHFLAYLIGMSRSLCSVRLALNPLATVPQDFQDSLKFSPLNKNTLIPQRGFTLLEMLVVLVVASIMLGVAAVQLFPDEQRALRDEGERLAYLLEQASLTSRAGGQALAWSVSGRDHRFWKRNKQGEWRRVEQDALLHPRSLPEGMRVTLVSVDGQAATAGEMLALSPELGAPEFELRLSSGDKVVRLLGDGLGNVKVSKP